MKKFKYCCFIIMFVVPLQAEMRTLIPESVSHGVYIAPLVSASPFGPNHEFGVSPGVQVGWTLNKRFTIGFRASQLWKNVDANWLHKQAPHYINLTYAGALFSYAHNPDALFHVEYFTLIGVGLAGYRIQIIGNFDNFDDDFFLVEPGAFFETNVTRFLKCGLGISYRITNGVEIQNLNDTDFSGLNYTAHFKIGIF